MSTQCGRWLAAAVAIRAIRSRPMSCTRSARRDPALHRAVDAGLEEADLGLAVERRSADCSSLVPKPAAPTFSTAGPSVSSQVMLRRSSDTVQDTCSRPRAEENAPYFPALVASSWKISARLTASLAGRNSGSPFRLNRTWPYGPSSERSKSLISQPLPSTRAIRSSVADSARIR